MPRPLAPDPPGIREVVTLDEALTAGMTPAQVRHRVRTGRWVRIAPATYRTQGTSTAPTAVQRREELLLRIAAVAQRHPGSVVGLGSAAVVHRLPLVTGDPGEVHLLTAPGRRNGPGRHARTHVGRFLDEDTELVAGPAGLLVAVTSAARTWCDVARTRPLADALSVGDAALRTGAMTRDDAAQVLERLGPMRGSQRAEQALALITPLRESPLESGSAARFFEWEFPEPRWQHEWFDDDGFIARSDADWARESVIGFADGLGKYELDRDRVRVERVQEARLRPHGTVARWGWPDMSGSGLGLYRLLAPLLRIDRPFPRSPERW